MILPLPRAVSRAPERRVMEVALMFNHRETAYRAAVAPESKSRDFVGRSNRA